MAKKKTQRAVKKPDISVQPHIGNELILSFYARNKNYSKTAKEFNTNPMRVKRLWGRLTDEQKREYEDAAAETADVVKEVINKIDTEFIRDQAELFRESLNLAGNELLNRLSPERVTSINTKDLLNAIALLNDICVAGDGDKEKAATSLYNLMDGSMYDSVINANNKDNGNE